MSAARSVIVEFVNQTQQALSRISFGLEHGIWSGDSQQVPPEQVNGIPAQWGSESDGFMTGTQGYVNYAIGGDASQVVNIQWDNPYGGTNQYPNSCPPGYSLSYVGGNGDNATVIFTLSKS